MTSRERVKVALNHQTPDCVPTDLWGSASRITNQLYFDLKKHFDITEEGRLIRPGTVTEYEDYILADRLNSDFRHINIGKPKGFKSYKNQQGFVIDEWGVGRDVSAIYPTVAYFPLAEAEVADLDGYNWPKPEDEGRIEGIEERAKDWFLNTDKAITATSPVSGMFFELAQFLRGPEEFFVDLYMNKEFAHKLIDKITDILIPLTLYYVKPIAPYIEWLEFTSDLGTQHAPFMSLDMFKEFFAEPFNRIFSAVKQAYPTVKIFFHSCGAIYDFIPELIKAGVDVLNPIQPLAKDMDPKRIKEEFGKDLVFHGVIDIQQAMRGSVEDVKKEVALRIDQMNINGGYILAPNNHLQPDVPFENVVAMYNYAKEYSKK